LISPASWLKIFNRVKDYPLPETISKDILKPSSERMESAFFREDHAGFGVILSIRENIDATCGSSDLSHGRLLAGFDAVW
jgi:hypothetical protein